MSISTSRGIAAALVCVLGLAVAAPNAMAQKKHDSNTLHKIGNAIQYPVRKAGENISITAHRVTGRNSVVHRRNGNRVYSSVITPDGRIHRKYRVGYHPKPRHVRHHKM